MDSTLFASPDPDTGELVPLENPPPFLRSGAQNGIFNYDTARASHASGLVCLDPSLAQQQFRDETDINTIVRNFGLTGQLPQQGAYPASGDFEIVTDYHTALNAVRLADEAFMALPPDIRSRFLNDPQKLMEFVADDRNHEAARAMGLTRPLSEPAKPVEVVIKPSGVQPAPGIPGLPPIPGTPAANPGTH